MKVVIFCGGLGVRMGEATQQIPKPMIRIGNRPILWELMTYYASWGLTDFVLCLGYKGDVIREYFLNYNEALFNDFVLDGRHREPKIELLSRDVGAWSVTFADTGINSTIAERLKRVEKYLDGDDFLATYGDGLTDAPLDDMLRVFRERDKMALLLSAATNYPGHRVEVDESDVVTELVELTRSNVRINAGFFVFKREILDWIEPGDELVDETFGRLIPCGEVTVYPYDGFFGPMDTIKDRQRLEALHESGEAPWRRVGLEASRQLDPLGLVRHAKRAPRARRAR